MSLGDADKFKRWRASPATMVRELFHAEPDPWQEEALELFAVNPRVALKASKGPGKLQPKSMMLDTPDGWRRWGDLVVGDRVFAPDGTPTKITAVHDNGVVEQWRVTFDDGSSTLCGSEHLWKVRGQAERMRVGYQRGHSEMWSVLTTEQILKRGVRVKNGRWAGRQFEIPRHEAVQWPAAELPADPYVLGVWLGDGDKRGGRYTGIDHEVQAEIERRGYAIGAESANGQTRGVVGMAAQLRRIGLVGLGSHERFIPEPYRYASVQQRLDLLCGLMDTDGCIGKDGHMEFDSTSHKLANDVVWLVRSLGGVAYFKQTVKRPWYYGANRERIAGRDCYRITVRTRECPFKIARKAERWRPARNKSQSRYLTRYIDRIDPAFPAQDSMCIEVEHPSQCYLANDFIVTHNTCCLAWMAWNFLLTREDPNIAATSISGDNLRDGLWKELSVWRARAPLLQAAFEVTTERVFLKGCRETWFMTARTWRQTASQDELGNTLAGLHADNILFLLDEAGGMPAAILAAAEGALSNTKDGHIVLAGNTNTLDGALYAACVKQAHLWRTVVITGDPDDPKRSSRINIDWAREMIATWGGRESPYVKVMILGEWPEASMFALLSANDVEAAMARKYQTYDIEGRPKVLGVDVARGGLDKSVLAPRQGLVMFKPHVMRNVNSVQGAAQVSRVWADWSLDGCFVDNTGGFGAGWLDQLQILNRPAIGVGFAERAEDDRRYFNRRAEMYFRLAHWIKEEGGALPPDVPEFLTELPAMTYTFKGDRLILEPKELVETKIGYSPDHSDAAALTFAAEVAPRPARVHVQVDETEYDPFAAWYAVR